uniref:Uncharacterized protein n=1 Tax=Romanomermis culicivorax TaxID=13658 RepID=A0A915I9P4_ROMCU
MTKIWIAKVKLSSDHYKPYFRLLIGSNVNRSSPICSLELIPDETPNLLESHRTKGHLTHFLAKLLIIGDYADENSTETSKNECLLFVWLSVARNYGLLNDDTVKIRRLDDAPRLPKIFLRALNDEVAEQLIDDLKNSDQSFVCNENDYLWFKNFADSYFTERPRRLWKIYDS